MRHRALLQVNYSGAGGRRGMGVQNGQHKDRIDENASGGLTSPLGWPPQLIGPHQPHEIESGDWLLCASVFLSYKETFSYS